VNFEIRIATPADREIIQQLIAISARELSRGYYSEEQVSAALKSVYGVDSMLIEDGTYFVAEADDIIIGCGGWSKRKTLFGGDQFSKRDAGLLDPRFEPAKIRAFFIHPNFARQGIGRAILDRCELDAASHGFISLELMSTLPGVEFYIACGYVATDPIFYDAAGVALEFVPMKKALPTPSAC
jgi:GNAT superfamily N-acetyltransferase